MRQELLRFLRVVPQIVRDRYFVCLGFSLGYAKKLSFGNLKKIAPKMAKPKLDPKYLKVLSTPPATLE